MTRALRIQFPGAVYQVNSRGNQKHLIFRDQTDRREFLIQLALVVERYGWIVHGYCLMGNHYHLLIETPRGNLSAGMRQLNGCYAQAFPARWNRVGHVFQGRFKATLVEKDGYLCELVRYLAMNPVRVDPPLCERPEDWQWSSYRVALGRAEKPEWLHTDWTLAQFGKGYATARARLKAFVDEALDGDLPAWPGVGIFVAGDEFVRAKTRGLDKPIPEIPRAHWDPLPPTLAAIFAVASDPMRAAHEDHGYTMREIAEHAGVHYSTVSRYLRKPP